MEICPGEVPFGEGEIFAPMADQEIWDAINDAAQPSPDYAEEIWGAIDEAAHPFGGHEEEIDDAIHEAATSPLPDEASGDALLGETIQDDLNADGEPPADEHVLSEAEAAALLVEILSRSAVSREGSRLRIDPGPLQMEQWDARRVRDVADIPRTVTSNPRGTRLIADALAMENARLEELMGQYEELLAEVDYDSEHPEALAMAQQIRELHMRIQELTDQS